MARVQPFHSDVNSPHYNPSELLVFHNQTSCGYGFRVMRDGKAKDGIGMTAAGYLRTLCGLCEGIHNREEAPLR